MSASQLIQLCILRTKFDQKEGNRVAQDLYPLVNHASLEKTAVAIAQNRLYFCW
ncbi:hypothetical protein ACQ4M3_14350 [Leptolyngbya sp. AN03gr2]|uniref:hypothetical protein n=1 Tax=unclassified Leptolyngbya TaxID=2650499 RepID=UPI003D317B9F